MSATGWFQRWHFVTIQSNKSVYMWIRAWLILILVSLYFSSDEETDRFALNRDKNDEGVWECEARNNSFVRLCSYQAMLHQFHAFYQERWCKCYYRDPSMKEKQQNEASNVPTSVFSHRWPLPFYPLDLSVSYLSTVLSSMSISRRTGGGRWFRRIHKWVLHTIHVDTGESLIFWGFKLLLPTVSLSSETLRMTSTTFRLRDLRVKIDQIEFLKTLPQFVEKQPRCRALGEPECSIQLTLPYHVR